ncbi:MAG TPA: hypothetical protein DC058_01565 [Planctomycetaceae bacterium]|nr:hypothetical protein [Planctomycetaceae bacterium]HBC59889.1 hypothetical protein [Planctomycetaceae bacterium]
MCPFFYPGLLRIARKLNRIGLSIPNATMDGGGRASKFQRGRKHELDLLTGDAPDRAGPQ